MNRVSIKAVVEVVTDGVLCADVCDYHYVSYCSLFHKDLARDAEGEHLRCTECVDAVSATESVPSLEFEAISDKRLAISRGADKYVFEVEAPLLFDRFKMNLQEFAEYGNKAVRRNDPILERLNEMNPKLVRGSKAGYKGLCDQVFNERVENRWLCDGYKLVGSLLTVTPDRIGTNVEDNHKSATVRWDIPIKAVPSKTAALSKIEAIRKLKVGEVLSRYEVRDILERSREVVNGPWNIARILWGSATGSRYKGMAPELKGLILEVNSDGDIVHVKTKFGEYKFSLDVVAESVLFEALRAAQSKADVQEIVQKFEGKLLEF